MVILSWSFSWLFCLGGSLGYFVLVVLLDSLSCLFSWFFSLGGSLCFSVVVVLMVILSWSLSWFFGLGGYLVSVFSSVFVFLLGLAQ